MMNGVHRGGTLSPSELGEAMQEIYQTLPQFPDDDEGDPRVVSLTRSLG